MPMRFEETGEERPPRRGEWYRSSMGLPTLATRDFAMRALSILCRIDDGERAPIEVEREDLNRLERDTDAARRAGVTPERPAVQPLHQTPPAASGELRPIGEAARGIRDEYLPYTDHDSED